MRTAYGIQGGSVNGDGNRTEWHDDFVDIVDYTGTRPRRCDGTPVSGELVITFSHRASMDKWTTTAATTAVGWDGTPIEIGAPIFGMLSGATPVSSSDVVQQAGDGRVARAFKAKWSRPTGSARGGDEVGDATAATQVLWIDGDSLLPTKWQVTVDDKAGYELIFNYMPLDLRPPEGIKSTNCIP